MSQFSPIDPKFLSPGSLPQTVAFPKKQEEIDSKKFEEELKKVKTDADQPKKRKREQEENEGSQKIIRDAQELIEKEEDSLYAIQKPIFRVAGKKKEPIPREEEIVPFLLPSTRRADDLFIEYGFSLPKEAPAAEAIRQEKYPIASDAIEGISEILDRNVEEISIELPPVSPVIPEREAPPASDPVAPPKVASVPEKTIPEEPASAALQPGPEPRFPFFFLLSPEESFPASNLHRLSPEIFSLFERMVGVITVMQTRPGISSTTIRLTQPEFASSVFFGSQITIEECDTALGQFNIRLSGPSPAVALFSDAKSELETALIEGFENGKFRFKVRRIEAEFASE